MAATMNVDEVAEELSYFTGARTGDKQPHRDKIYGLARAGRIPPPIDSGLSTLDWRWSRALIDLYVAGQWQARKVAS